MKKLNWLGDTCISSANFHSTHELKNQFQIQAFWVEILIVVRENFHLSREIFIKVSSCSWQLESLTSLTLLQFWFWFKCSSMTALTVQARCAKKVRMAATIAAGWHELVNRKNVTSLPVSEECSICEWDRRVGRGKNWKDRDSVENQTNSFSYLIQLNSYNSEHKLQ